MNELTGETTRASFDDTVRRNERQVLRIAYRMLGNWADAEDVAQEAFLRLHRDGLAKFSGDDAATAWLCRVTVNLCLDRGRSRSRWRAGEMPELAVAASAESDALRDERRRQLIAAVASLPERERAAVVLREIEGLTTAETARALGSSEVTVRSQVSKAMGRLREWMTK